MRILDADESNEIKLLWISGARLPDIRAYVDSIGKSVTDATILSYRRRPDVVAAIQRAYDEAIDAGVSKRGARIMQMQKRLDALYDIRSSRAIFYTEDDGDGNRREIHPGSGTGLMVKRIKIIGSKEMAMQVEEWELDTGLLAACKDLERAIADEIGDSPASKIDVSGKLEVEMTNEQRVNRLFRIFATASARALPAPGLDAGNGHDPGDDRSDDAASLEAGEEGS